MPFQHSRRAVWALMCAILLGMIAYTLGKVSIFGQNTGYLIQVGDEWRYFKGYSEASEPVTAWREIDFDDGSWLIGPTGIGYGDGDDATVLGDMRYNYISVFMRRTFTVADPAGVSALVLEVDYDDGFVAYLNGTEVARRKLGSPGSPVAYDAATSSGHEARGMEGIDLGASIELLRSGANVLAIQGHNRSLSSSDFSMIPALRWEYVPSTPTTTPTPTPLQALLIPGAWLPVIVKHWCPPSVAFTYVPPYGTFDNLRGLVHCANPAEHRIAVYMYVSGWWSKPTWARPLTTIRSDGSWSCDITAGGQGQRATKIVAFLVPNGYDPPLLEGDQALPNELYDVALAHALVETPTATAALTNTPTATPIPTRSTGYLIQVGDEWRYFKGYGEASEPVTAWREIDFDDESWLIGPTGIGYGDGAAFVLLMLK